MSENQTRVEITVGGTVSCIDDEGGRPLAFDEFDALVDKIAAHLDSAPGVSVELSDLCGEFAVELADFSR